MSFRTNRLGQQVSDIYESSTDKYMIDVEYDNDDDGDIPLSSKDQRVSSANNFESEEDIEEEATTPILRPWTKTNFRKVATSDVHKDYDPSHYVSGGSDFTHSSTDHSPISQSSEDKDEIPNVQSTEPLTPSRLLTLNSFDFNFMDAGGDDADHSHVSSTGHSSDSLRQSRDSRYQSKHDCSGQPAHKITQHSPITSPKSNRAEHIEAVIDDDLQKELTIHGDIVSEYATQLTISLQDHMSELIVKLTGQKETELHGRDTFYTKELQKQQIIIEDLEEVVSTYEKNLLNEEATVVHYRAMMESICVKMNEQYVSPFSSIRLFQHWCMFTDERKRMSRLFQLASRHHKKKTQRAVFDEFKRESNALRAERRRFEEKKHFDKTVRDLVSRYETQIAILTADLQESQESLGTEKARRQQLEEDLRRMFLKNMTVMNMEALSLFQTPVAAPPQLAEFGPEKKHAYDMQKVEATQQRQEEMISHMKKQQQQLRSHQQVYSAHTKPMSGDIPVQSSVQQTSQGVRHNRRGQSYSVERQSQPIEQSPSSRQSHSHSPSHSDLYTAEWEDEEEEYPRDIPHPLPYSSLGSGGYRH